MKKFLVLVFLLSQTVFANETLLLPTKIGNTVFNDVLVLDSTKSAPLNGDLVGTLTVAGSFSAPIENATIITQCIVSVIDFTITAHENGEVTVVKYHLFYLRDFSKTISGTLSLVDGTVIGQVVGGKNTAD